MSSRHAKQDSSKTASKTRKSTTSKSDKDNGKDPARASTSKSELVERLSQSSTSTNDDELAQALLKKLQSGLEKKQKDKETKCLAAYEKELTEIQTRSRAEINQCCDEIDEAYESFVLEYAQLEDHIRALWVKIAKTFEPYIDLIEEQIRTEEQNDKDREKEQKRGLAYHAKADEDFHKLIATLLEEIK